MKSIGILFVLVFLGLASAEGQVRGRPDPTPMTPVEQAVQRSNDIRRRSNELNNVERFPVKTDDERRVFLKAIRPLYRKLTDEETALLSPSIEDSTKYESFLDQKNTGLTMLVTDKGCANDTKVVEASPDCAEFSMPGAGSAYSFRNERHRIHRLADINFKQNTFQALGTLTHGILVNLGDTPIEQIDLKTDGVSYLAKLKPAKDMASAGDLATKLRRGIKGGKYTYASILPVKAGATYVLRSIAYRGVIPVTIEGVSYNEIQERLGFDKRKDIIIAFKVVRFAQTENVTILWKELRSNKAPMLKVKK